jgi:hypothetical protein
MDGKEERKKKRKGDSEGRRNTWGYVEGKKERQQEVVYKKFLIVENLRILCVEWNGMCPYVKANSHSDLQWPVLDSKL